MSSYQNSMQGAGYSGDFLDKTAKGSSWSPTSALSTNQVAAFKTQPASIRGSPVSRAESGQTSKSSTDAESSQGGQAVKHAKSNISPSPPADNHMRQPHCAPPFSEAMLEGSPDTICALDANILKQNLNCTVLSYLPFNPDLTFQFLKQNQYLLWSFLLQNPAYIAKFVHQNYGMVLPITLSAEEAIKPEVRMKPSSRTGASKIKHSAACQGPYQPTSNLGHFNELPEFPKITIRDGCRHTNKVNHIQWPPAPWVEDDPDDFSTNAASAKNSACFQPNPSGRGPGHTWAEPEVNSCLNHMMDIRDEGVIKGEARFAEASRRMRLDSFFRTPIGVKNYWGRYGRAITGFDERRNKNSPLSTSKQGKEARIANALKKKEKALQAAASKKRKATGISGDSGRRKKPNDRNNPFEGPCPAVYREINRQSLQSQQCSYEHEPLSTSTTAYAGVPSSQPRNPGLVAGFPIMREPAPAPSQPVPAQSQTVPAQSQSATTENKASFQLNGGSKGNSLSNLAKYAETERDLFEKFGNAMPGYQPDFAVDQKASESLGVGTPGYQLASTVDQNTLEVGGPGYHHASTTLNHNHADLNCNSYFANQETANANNANNTTNSIHSFTTGDFSINFADLWVQNALQSATDSAVLGFSNT